MDKKENMFILIKVSLLKENGEMANHQEKLNKKYYLTNNKFIFKDNSITKVKNRAKNVLI